MSAYSKWLARAMLDLHPMTSLRYRSGFQEGSGTAWMHVEQIVKRQQRTIAACGKEIDKAGKRLARSVRTGQLRKRRIEILERANRNLQTQLRIYRDE